MVRSELLVGVTILAAWAAEAALGSVPADVAVGAVVEDACSAAEAMPGLREHPR